MFGDGFEIEIRIEPDKSKLKIAKDEGIIEIVNPSDFKESKPPIADAENSGRRIRVNSDKKTLNSDGTIMSAGCVDNSAYAEEIGHIGGLHHPHELRAAGEYPLEMEGVNYGNFMSYPDKDVADISEKHIMTKGKANSIIKRFLEKPTGATRGQKNQIKKNFDSKKLNQDT